MNQEKIGRFIAKCRKEKNLTQMQLAEKLNITDRAVSKWERGKAMPDVSIMLDLCNILEITVNDLLNGEVLTMENYNEKTEELLIEALRQKQEADKRLLTIEWVLGIISCIVLFVPIFIAAYVPMEDWQRTVVIFSGFIPSIIGLVFCIKIEQVAGYYECKHCGHKYVPTFKAIFIAPHIGRTRYIKCPKCHKKTWCKKVLSKED